MTAWKTEKSKALVKALLTLTTEDDLFAFLRDLLTEPEIEELSERFAAARLLAAGKSQREVAREVGLSLMTVTRVNKWLRRGEGGYRKAIRNTNEKN
jgi:TrpR-related protein YerC/YecD